MTFGMIFRSYFRKWNYVWHFISEPLKMSCVRNIKKLSFYFLFSLFTPIKLENMLFKNVKSWSENEKLGIETQNKNTDFIHKTKWALMFCLLSWKSMKRWNGQAGCSIGFDRRLISLEPSMGQGRFCRDNLFFEQ